EPCEARALADAAVRDDRTVAGDALIGVQLLQLRFALERAVVVAVLSPGDALRAWNVAAALAGFRKSRRREDLARELRGTADVDELRLLLRRRLLHVRQERTQRHIRRRRLVRLRGERRLLRAQVAGYGKPLLAAPVHDPHVLVAVHPELPERPRGEPVVVVAVEHDRRVVVDAALTEQLLQLPDGNDVAHERVAQLGRPVPSGGAGDVSLVVRRGIHVDLGDADVGVFGVLRYPVGRYENVSHVGSFQELYILYGRPQPRTRFVKASYAPGAR